MEKSQQIKKTNWLERFFRFLVRFQDNHWVVSWILFKLSAVWFSLIIAFCGEQLKLVKVTNSTKSFTLLGWVFTIVLIITISLFEISKKAVSKIDKQLHEVGGYGLLYNLRRSTGKICESKINTLLTEIENVKLDHSSPPHIVSNPRNQLARIAQEMEDCLKKLLDEDDGRGSKNDDLHVTIAYKFLKDEKEWHWATREHGLNFQELLLDPGDTIFRKLVSDPKRSRIFYNSKQEAFSKGEYKIDKYDEMNASGALLGSIACYKIDVTKNDTTYVRAILSISTYDHQFTSDTSKEAAYTVKENMSNFVFADFSKRIEVELCLLYLSYLEESAKKP